jgi:transposase
LNLDVAVDNDRQTGSGQVGIDLGLKSLATVSDGVVIENPRHLRNLSGKLAKAQRAGRKAIARKIHRKIAAKRRHFLHEVSAKIARENALICVGNVNSASLIRTRMAKSILDAGWSVLRSQLRYKAIRHGALFVDTDERWSTQTCSDCGRIGGPKGLKGLRVRQWECEGCGASHDRDMNAARNILASGRSIALH